MGEIQNSVGRVKTLPPDAVKDGCGEEAQGVLGARVGVGGWWWCWWAPNGPIVLWTVEARGCSTGQCAGLGY